MIELGGILFLVIGASFLVLLIVLFLRRFTTGARASTDLVGPTAGRVPLSADEFHATYYAGKGISKSACLQMLGLFSVITGVSGKLLRPEDKIADFGPIQGMGRSVAVTAGTQLDRLVAEARQLAEGSALPEKLVTLDDCIRAVSILERIHGKV